MKMSGQVPEPGSLAGTQPELAEQPLRRDQGVRRRLRLGRPLQVRRLRPMQQTVIAHQPEQLKS